MVSTPLKNMFVKLDHFPRDRGVNKQCFKPPPRNQYSSAKFWSILMKYIWFGLWGAYIYKTFFCVVASMANLWRSRSSFHQIFLSENRHLQSWKAPISTAIPLSRKNPVAKKSQAPRRWMASSWSQPIQWKNMRVLGFKACQIGSSPQVG